MQRNHWFLVNRLAGFSNRHGLLCFSMHITLLQRQLRVVRQKWAVLTITLSEIRATSTAFCVMVQQSSQNINMNLKFGTLASSLQAPFSSQFFFHSIRHIEYSDTCMEH